MNCRPGDVARVARNVMLNPCTASVRDRFVVVDAVIGFDWLFGPMWRLREPIPCRCHDGGHVILQLDADLQPIRGLPGEDETIGWVEDKARAANRDGVSA